MSKTWKDRVRTDDMKESHERNRKMRKERGKWFQEKVEALMYEHLIAGLRDDDEEQGEPVHKKQQTLPSGSTR